MPDVSEVGLWTRPEAKLQPKNYPDKGLFIDAVKVDGYYASVNAIML